jgi:hypothetical protein
VEAVITAAVAPATNCLAEPIPATLLSKTKPPGQNISPEAFLFDHRYTSKGTNDRYRENPMQKQVFTVGERTDKVCAVCDEERGHIVTSVTKRGQISRVSCSKCGTISTFKLTSRTSPRPSTKTPSPYDRTLTYRAGQSMTHDMFGIGEVTRLIEPRKMEVLFQDRLRRLIHAQSPE